ncbi:B12-binding domain-containing radical SAM protein [Chakrabartyella piscis]|uniref:B12-binding domain-containing radical SAM protein n=1 Tax=Chakrabartyella piscis TaxID=2918914 RepID=UPI002958B26D|nr:B12-binding domain-containing radical SAM protein [Chakrabartyella piscis]
MKILLTAINAKFIHSSLAVRYLYSYAKEYQEYITPLEYTINNQEDEILADLYGYQPDVICFSCYIWNINMICSLARNLKKIMPNVKIVCGGPEVSYESEALLEKNPSIDAIIRGEGEEAFKQMVSAFVNGTSLREINGMSLREGDTILSTPPSTALCLDKLPFPYDENLTGLDHRILYYETQRGCPFNCQFCLSSVEKGVRFVSLEKVFGQLDFFLERNVKQVKFVDRSYNCNKKHSHGIWKYLMEHDNGITNFHMEIEAHLVDDETIELLRGARPNLFQFEIGIQSTNEETLKAVQRNGDFAELKHRILQIKELGNIHVHVDLIAGLPYEGYESFRKSFNDVFDLGAQQLQMGFLKVLKGSGLHRDSEKYNIGYREDGPYEVLYTNDISYGELIRLKGIEELLETFYNSGKTVHTMDYVIPHFPSAFDFFEAFSDYWMEKEYHKIKHTKANLYEKLREFLLQSDYMKDHISQVENLLKFDMLLHDNLPSIPTWAVSTLDGEAFKKIKRDFFHNEENKETYLQKLAGYTPTQLGRMCRLEQFSCNVLESDVPEGEVFILLNYYDRDVFHNCAKTDQIAITM